MQMVWTVEKADREGNWTWGARDWSENDWGAVIYPKLREFQALRWLEIESFTTGSEHDRHRMHHSMPVDTICTESQNRLTQLSLDYDEIYRFRLGNRRRLWGFRIVNVFETLWYDPLHKIYPTDPS
jgi:hypothetical protein